MSQKSHRGHRETRRLYKITRQSAHVVKRTFVTLGDLISAAYEVGGSSDAAALLLSPLSPLGHLLNRRIIVAA